MQCSIQCFSFDLRDLKMPGCCSFQMPWWTVAGWLACFGSALSKPMHLLTSTTHFSGLRPCSSCCRIRLSSTGCWGGAAGSGATWATDQGCLAVSMAATLSAQTPAQWSGAEGGGVVCHSMSTFPCVLAVRAGELAGESAGSALALRTGCVWITVVSVGCCKLGRCANKGYSRGAWVCYKWA